MIYSDNVSVAKHLIVDMFCKKCIFTFNGQIHNEIDDDLNPY